MLNQHQTARLAALHNYGTAYELILTNGAQRYLVTYCRKTGPGLVAALRRAITGQTTRLDFVAELTHTSAQSWKWTGPREVASGEWRIAFSGRTEREAITLGELPRVTQSIPQPAAIAA